MTQIDFKVPLPVAGDKAFLSIDVNGLEALHKDFGDDYRQAIMEAFDRYSIPVLRRCLEVMLQESDKTPDEIMNASIYDDVAVPVADAIHLRLLGRKVSAAMETDDAAGTAVEGLPTPDSLSGVSVTGKK